MSGNQGQLTTRKSNSEGEAIMRTKTAVAHVLKHKGLTKYALAQELGCAPVSIDQWLKRTRMSRAYAEIFYKKFKVQVNDAV